MNWFDFEMTSFEMRAPQVPVWAKEEKLERQVALSELWNLGGKMLKAQRQRVKEFRDKLSGGQKRSVNEKNTIYRKNMQNA